MRTFILTFLFFALITKNSCSFTFKICDYFANKRCHDIVFPEESFTATMINDYYNKNSSYSNIYIDAINETEMTINADGITSHVQIHFDNIQENAVLYIETNNIEYIPSYPSYCPSIFAENLDVIIENLNKNNKNRTIYACDHLEAKSISSKDPNMPLFLPKFGKSINLNRIKSSVFYTTDSEFTLEDHLDESKTAIISILNPYADYFRMSFHTFADMNVTFGKSEIRFVYTDGKTFTAKYECNHRFWTGSIRFHEHAVISVDDGLFEDDLVFIMLDSSNVIEGETPEIIGNWPEAKKALESGSNDNQYLSGKFIYSANNFPAFLFHELVLSKRVSSIYIIGDYVPIEPKISLLNDEETIFILNGLTLPASSFTSYQNRTHGDPKLTILFNSQIRVNPLNQTKEVYQLIDNTQLSIGDDVLDFQLGGTVKTPFGIDYRDVYGDMKEIYEEYKGQNKMPGSESLPSEKYNYLFDFVKSKISDLSNLVNTYITAKGIPVTVNPADILNKAGQVSTVVLSRYDFLITSTYKEVMNKATNVICAATGTLDSSKWNVKLGTNLISAFITRPKAYSKFIPSFSNTNFPFDVVSTENGRCIGIKPTGIPKRGVEFIFYTTNETYLEILEKVNLFVTLTASDLDAFSKLSDSTSKNYFVFVLNDLPANSAINLKGIPRDSKVFLIGIKDTSLDLIYDCLDFYEKLDKKDESYSVNLAEFLTKYAVKYGEYQVKASVNHDAVHTLFLALVNYYGTQVRCTMFYALLCSFTDLNKLSSRFSTQVTWTDSLTYKEMSSLKFVDLLVLPVSTDPPNILCVERIDFSSNEYTLHMRGGLNGDRGFYVEESRTMTIDAKKIRGILMIYSVAGTCVMNAADEKIKGLKYVCIDVKDIKDIEYMVTLEDSSSWMNIRDSGETPVFTFEGSWDKVSEIEGKVEISTGTKSVVVEKVPQVVASVLDVKSDEDIKISTIGGGTSEKSVIKFGQQQLIESKKVINFDDANTDVSFADLKFVKSSSSLSLLLGKSNAKVVADRVEIGPSTAAVVNGDLEVLEELEIGPCGSIEANSISSIIPRLVLDYRVGEKFGSVPDSIEPSSIVLNYIGESSNTDEVSDYAPSIGRINVIRTFGGENHRSKCEEWREKASFKSATYPEFGSDTKFVKLLCIDSEDTSELVLNLTAIPEGVTSEPTTDIELPPLEYETSVPNPDQPGDDVNDGNNGNNSNNGNENNENNNGGNNEGSNGYEGGSGGGENGSDKKDKKFPTAAIVGIVVGVIVAIAVACILVWLFVIRKPKGNAGKETKEVKEDKKEIIKKEDSNDEDSDIYFSMGIIEDVE